MAQPLARGALWSAGLLACALAVFASWRALDRPEPEPALTPPIAVPPGATPPAHTPHTGTPLDPGTRVTPRHDPGAVDTQPFVITGRARTHVGASAPGVELALVRASAAGERALGRTTSASDGRFRFELAAADCAAALEDGLDGELVLRARAPGFQPARERRQVADVLARAGAARTYEWTVVLVPGQVLRGRTVDAAQKPVAGAEVRLLAPSTRGAVPVTNVVARGTSDADGRFEIGYASSGEYQLAARAENTGTAWIDALALLASHDMELGDVLLDGAGRLAGHVLRARGAPASGLELWALPADGRTRPAVSLAAARALSERERGDGLGWSRTRTDGDGAFAFTGLRPGAYQLLAPHAGVRFDPVPEPYTTPAEALVLRVASTGIEVLVRDENGAPLAGAAVACAQLALDGDGEAQLTARAFATTAADGSARFDVDAEHTYSLRAELGARVVEERVELASGQDTLAHVLVLGSAEGPARLRLAVHGSLGEPVHDFRVHLLSALTGERLAALTDLAPGASGDIGPLPAGRYRVEVVPRARANEPVFWLAARPRDEIVLGPGSTTALEVTLVTGAALRVELELAGPPPAEFAFKTERELDARARATALRAHELARSASASLVPLAPAGSPRALAFDVPVENSEAPPALASTLLPGRGADVHGRFAPGTYRLVVDAPGFAPASEEIVLAAGETRTVRVGLHAP